MPKDLIKAARIWQTVQAIPEGKVASYGQVADLAGLPGRARLVGKAMSYAPKDMILPWHRVLRSNGQLAFKAGSQYGKIQSENLMAEDIPVIKNRVNFARFGWQPSLSEMLEKLDFSQTIESQAKVSQTTE